MAQDRFQQSMDEKLSEEQYARIEEERLVTEAEALQEEVITRIPGFIKLMMNYEWKPMVKVIASIIIMVIIYFLVGWDAVASALMIFIFIALITYFIIVKFQEKDSTIFVEMKLPGQRIETGEHSPYSKSFFTTEKRFALWEVPNTLIRRGLFKLPGDQEVSLMPGSGKVIFVDLFDRINRTCVLPRDLDVANIAYATNANPSLAEKMTRVGEQIKLDAQTEQVILDMYSTGKLKASEAKKAIEPIKIRKRALLSPTSTTRRDIFYELQSMVPEMREKIQFLSNKMFLLAEFLAAKGIYQSVNRAMPESIRQDHNFVRKIMGLPEIKEGKKSLMEE